MHTIIKKIIIVLLIFVTSLFCNLLYEKGFASGNTYYVDPQNGSDLNPGSLSNPWKTLKGSIPKLKPGDILYLRGGIYYERDIWIDTSGTKSQPITIKGYPGENPIIDGGYQEFRDIPNNDWELYDKKKLIYRSVKTYPEGSVGGYFVENDTWYQLVAYENWECFAADNEYVDDNGWYIGPGVIYNSSDKKIYIRLKHTQVQISKGWQVPSKTDPSLVKIYLFRRGKLLNFRHASYINLEGLIIRFQDTLLHFLPDANNITIKDCVVIGGAYPIEARSGAHSIVFDGINVNHYIPPWIAWGDVKWSPYPGHAFQGPAILLNGAPYNIEIKNCRICNIFDAIDALGGAVHDVHIHHNEFYGIRDDVLQLDSRAYNIEVNNNKLIHVSIGFSKHGRTAASMPGKVYIHHNIIDASKPYLQCRKKADGTWPSDKCKASEEGFICDAPFGSHHGNTAAWKIYNNTAIFGKNIDWNGAGSVVVRCHESFNGLQEVYNNIFWQIDDFRILDDCRIGPKVIFDGNLYYRSYNNPTDPLFTYFDCYADPHNYKHFDSLKEFKSSQFFEESKKYYPPGWENSGVEADPKLDSEYYPDPNGPAATGAIDLSSKGWPGIDGGKYRGALPPKVASEPNPPQNLRIINK